MHERGYLKGSFVISKGHDPGNPFASYEYWLKRKSILEKITEEERKELQKYFLSRKGKDAVNGFNFKGGNKTTNDRFSTNESYVVMYTSSSDEISGYNIHCTYQKQLDLIVQLAEMAKKNGIDLVVRQHPNLGRIGRPNRARNFLEKTNKLKEIYQKTISIYEPEDSIDSYKLAENAMLIFSPQSSIYMELAYDNKPVVQIQESPYGILTRSKLKMEDIGNLSIKQLKKHMTEQRKDKRILDIATMHMIKSSIVFGSIARGFLPELRDTSEDKDDTEKVKSILDRAAEDYYGYILRD